MAGAIEEAGKVAGGFIDAMAREPLALSLCVISFALIGCSCTTKTPASMSQREANVKLFVGMQTEVQKLLSQCIVPAPAPKGG